MVTTLRACATCAIATVALLVTGLFHTRAAPARPIEAGTGLIAHTEQTAHICHLIESSAATDGIPVDFFTRLIWQESSFRSHAVSPKGAQGIAQFMPTTAAERGLADPFDPEQAIPASARYLRELHDRLGNLGLAAAAYNAGPDRVRAWLDGRAGLPLETRAFVTRITGFPPEYWQQPADEPATGSQRADEVAKVRSCLEFVAHLPVSRGVAAQVRPGTGGEPVAPWGVQLAAHFDRARALAAFDRIRGSFRSILEDRAPVVIRKLNRSRGTRPLYNVRIPAQSRDEAAALCSRLLEAGGNCVVLAN